MMNEAGRSVAPWCTALTLVLSGLPALAADAGAQLQRFVSEVSSATGRFTQQVATGQGDARPQQAGEFAFQRPGKFRWHVVKPYEQLVVSNGTVLRQYHPDPAQLTEPPGAQAIGALTAAIPIGAG